MEKILLVDGYSLMFRAYYATAYGQVMKTSSGIPTNAIFAFSNMFMKVIDQIKPDKVLVAFDSGKKNFRHELFENYKGTRKDAPSDLVMQFPIVREFLSSFGIPWVEVNGFEADDIVGSLSRKFAFAKVDILSSDRDLLQLINENVNVLMTKNGVAELKRMDLAALQEEYSLSPAQIIDLKGLMGDASDNIPGIPKVGEKTATKWLLQYGTLENVLDHADEIGGKTGELVKIYADQARLSKQLATIHLHVEVDVSFEECHFQINAFELKKFYEKYEMRSLINRLNFDVEMETEIKNHPIHSLLDSDLSKQAMPLGLHVIAEHGLVLISDGEKVYQGKLLDIANAVPWKLWFENTPFIVHHIKDTLHSLAPYGMRLAKPCTDLHIASFLIDSNEPADLHSLIHVHTNENLNLLDKKLFEKPLDEIVQLFARAIIHFKNLNEKFHQRMKKDDLLSLYEEVELPLAHVLFDMEREGICVDLGVLEEIAAKTKEKVDALADQAYIYALREFNLNSPKQLAEVLFDEMGLPVNKKRSTAVDVLEKLSAKHPIIDTILEYRKYQKLYSTYAEGLQKYVAEDGKIHTSYQQCLTQTGRLSSKDPNLQNISVRNEETKEVRRAFVAKDDNHVLLSADYSQVELRMLAHMSDSEDLIHVFRSGGDIHTSTAMKIFHVEADQVTSLMRRQAKAINFGIVYGISDFGLASQIGITRAEAKEFIERYFLAFPQIQPFMNAVVAGCEENGYVTTILKRRRYIKEIHDKNFVVRDAGKRAAMNAPIQGSAADLIKVAMIAIAKRIQERSLSSKMILQVHDELIFDVPVHEISIMEELVKAEMEQAIQLHVPLRVDLSHGRNWLEAK